MNQPTNNQPDGQKMKQMVTMKKGTNIPQGLWGSMILRWYMFFLETIVNDMNLLRWDLQFFMINEYFFLLWVWIGVIQKTTTRHDACFLQWE